MTNSMYESNVSILSFWRGSDWTGRDSNFIQAAGRHPTCLYSDEQINKRNVQANVKRIDTLRFTFFLRPSLANVGENVSWRFSIFLSFSIALLNHVTRGGGGSGGVWRVMSHHLPFRHFPNHVGKHVLVKLMRLSLGQRRRDTGSKSYALRPLWSSLKRRWRNSACIREVYQRSGLLKLGSKTKVFFAWLCPKH